MNKDEISVELENFLEGYLNSRGLELVELICRQEGRNLALRIFVDKPQGGISLSECTQLNRNISDILDEKDLIQASYILEVSSPGLDRPLRTKSDFARCLNRPVKFFLSEAINGKIEIDGIIKEPLVEGVNIETKAGTVFVAFSKINKAKQII